MCLFLVKVNTHVLEESLFYKSHLRKEIQHCKSQFIELYVDQTPFQWYSYENSYAR
jgi:hypothetical protein